ncbi:MAG TPA: isoleucine--tRNA ligase [Firmicutes bacterium]|nr:isoleucine--tRNA ligase [Bacillota bacterium]
MRDYKDTLNLPATDFSMRANLTVREPETLKKWAENDLYGGMLRANEGNESFVLHDGPPFSNGNIHMGTAMNKILKDFINKSKSMQGFRTPYVPGWDNHGMPIESAIIKKNKLDRSRMTVPAFRSACRDFAANFVDIQRESFKRLGVVGDWDNPYLTMTPGFEATEVRAFGEMYRKGYIYKGLKPVYWCPKDETALAEAEIEYQDDACTSIYVKFRVRDDKGLLAPLCDLSRAYFVIWTTTPWTLPGNMAIALHPREDYVLVRAADGDCYITASALCAKTMQAGGLDSYEELAHFSGGELEYMTAAHPFLERDSLVVCADYVTMDSGTGCVHTAPGFGVDDYRTGMKYGMEILVPVDDKGRQTADAGKFAGMDYEASNAAILDDLRASGALLASEELTHSYPHCWRCKNPIIFRATPQWFCAVDRFRDDALKACGGIQWIPAWGGDRMVSMIKERSDWCISRQRYWGLPIPVFYCADCGEIICDEQTIERVASLFAAHGSNVWFEKEASELLPNGYTCPKCGGTHFAKETDTLDGWFDSGSTNLAVLEGRKELKWPADLYLEGADQYRGWFQSSLLEAVAVRGGSPYKAVLTHGWTVDGEGKAMHKSLGNTVAPEDMIKKYGAEMVRLWVASSDYRVDVRVSEPIFKQLSESYRKIRNTLRILLANLGTPETDFDPNRDMVAPESLTDIDKWALSRLNGLVRDAVNAYNEYTFHNVYHDILSFCAIDLSKLYVDITKDRLYCERKDDPRRRGTQTVMYLTVSALTRLLAPILSFTAEEVWASMSHLEGENLESVFYNRLPAYQPAYAFPEVEKKYDALFTYRDDVMKALELSRAAGTIGKSLEACVTVCGDEKNEAFALFREFEPILPEIFIVSSVELCSGPAPAGAFTETASGIAVAVSPASGEKCVRCWVSSEACTHDEDGQALCERCRNVISHLS